MKNYKTAPLPFQGQKRTFATAFQKKLNEFPKDAIYVDLFGGSGLLSHNVKCVYPSAKVVYNDYDNFKKRIENIPKTNLLRADIFSILKGYPRKKEIDIETKNKIIDRVAKEDGYIDWITLSTWVLFSMKYAFSYEELKKEKFYNRIRMSDFDAADYLQGVECVSCDYKVLYEKYKDQANVVFLVDPPYLSTDTATYNSDKYWKLRDYLDVLKVLHNNNYFYFTSNKSNIIELCSWIEEQQPFYNPFNSANITTTKAQTTGQSSYTDIMIIKHNYILKNE